MPPNFKQWANFEWKEDASNFEFFVDYPDTAFHAIRDVQKLVLAGSVSGVKRPYTITPKEACLAFASIGFVPRQEEDQRLSVALLSGVAGEVGARYGYSFRFPPRLGSEAKVEIEIMNVVDEDDLKEVVLHTRCEAPNMPKVGNCESVEDVIKAETESRFLIHSVDRHWKVKFSHNGVHPVDDIEIEGAISYYGSKTALGLCCPCFFPCLVYDCRNEPKRPHRHISAQLWSIKEYLNGQELPTLQAVRTVTAQQEPAQTRFVTRPIEEEIAVAVPVPMGSMYEGRRNEDDKAEKLEKWHKLYKSGAITLEEYEREKAVILKE